MADEATRPVRDRFDLQGRVAIVTGGAGLLGANHALAIAELGGTPVLADIDGERSSAAQEKLSEFGCEVMAVAADVTSESSVQQLLARVLERFGRVDILINNAARNPTVEGNEGAAWARLESFALSDWALDLEVGLTGAFLCSKVIGGELARRGSGVIVNIASDLALIAPDQRIYRQPGVPDDKQPVKPASYSVVKAGLLGLTRYLATYWAGSGVRVNALCPGGVGNEQPVEFTKRLMELIPMRRMAQPDEYRAAVAFLVSDASSYMTGATLVVDGGRTCW